MSSGYVYFNPNVKTEPRECSSKDLASVSTNIHLHRNNKHLNGTI